MGSLEQHFILTLGRSGSNTLVNLLNQHPALLNYGEVLGDWNTIRKLYNRLPGALKRGEAAYLDALLHNRSIACGLNIYRNLSHLRRGHTGESKRFGALRTIGVKEFSLNLQRRGIADFLAARPHIRVIGLERNDLLERFVSWKMLQSTGIIKLEGAQTGSARQIQLDPGTLAEELRMIARENRNLHDMLDALPAAQVLRLSYDDLYSGPERTQNAIDEVTRFLGLPAFTPEIRMRKIIRGHPSERIANLDVCRSALQNTEFSTLLSD